jgi:RNA polymerase sigma factor (sigma-70 family)
MLKKDNNNRGWMRNMFCLLCLQSSVIGTHSFLPSHSNFRTFIQVPSSTHTNISTSTILHSTKPTDKQKKIQRSDKTRSKESKGTPRQRRKVRLPDVNKVESGALFQREAMLQHDILEKETEIILSNQILKAKKLRDLMTNIIEDRKLQMVNDFDGTDEFGDELLWGSDAPFSDDLDGYDNDIYVTSFSNQSERWNDSWENFDFAGDKRISSTLVKDGSKLSLDSLDADINMLTDYDISETLKVEGGRKELKRLIHLGAKARTTLMKSNIRLVVSISKKWIGKNYSGSSTDGSIAVNLYNGGWDRPSLDEVVQEGVLGLARAVDKFDPSRGLRFSTYSTHWITSYVRQCFQASTTGCLKVPSQLHEIKNTYKSMVKRCIESSEPIPSEDEIASMIGCSLNRLRTALRVTNPLISIDEPIYSTGNAAFKGSGAGGDNSGTNAMLIMDRLECTEVPPEDYVDISFLRQSLENAMAAELSPHERDIVRLRLGLDDGQTRTIKQIADECGGGITTADVRSAERRALKKLRSPNSIYSHNLIAYLDMAGIDDVDGPKKIY